jgi:hypothetical protein
MQIDVSLSSPRAPRLQVVVRAHVLVAFSATIHVDSLAAST